MTDRRHASFALRKQANQDRVSACESVPSSTAHAPYEARKRLERIFEDNHAFVWRLLRRLGLSRELAADMTQQAFLIAAERLDAIKRGSERAFLFGTALRLARTASRVNRRWLLQDDLDQTLQSACDVEALADQRQATEVLDRVLASIPENLVTVFVLFELEGLSAPEVARVVGIPVGTVASRVRRARELFRARVAEIRKSSHRRQKR